MVKLLGLILGINSVKTCYCDTIGDVLPSVGVPR